MEIHFHQQRADGSEITKIKIIDPAQKKRNRRKKKRNKLLKKIVAFIEKLLAAIIAGSLNG